MTGTHDLRCASLARAKDHAPLGTAGDNRGYLLVDWPLPWPNDIGDIPELAPLHERAARLGVRVQAVVPRRATALLDAESVRTVVGRRGPVEAVLPSFRGSTGLGSARLQALERHAFDKVGWGWLDWRRTGRDGGDGRATLVAEASDGSRASWVAAFASTPRRVPECGRPLTEARKHHDEPVLLDVRRTA